METPFWEPSLISFVQFNLTQNKKLNPKEQKNKIKYWNGAKKNLVNRPMLQ